MYFYPPKVFLGINMEERMKRCGYLCWLEHSFALIHSAPSQALKAAIRVPQDDGSKRMDY